MTAIKQEDLIQSVADAFQYISYYHPLDYIKALGEAYEREESPAAKDAIAQILTNSRMAAEGHRPICQDTGIGMVFIKVGMNVTWPDATMSIQKMIDEGVRRAYANPDNPLRASVLADPAGARKNTKDNTPAVVHFEIVEGHHVEVICAAKGGGSEAKSKFAMLNPSDDLVDWVLKKIPEMGAGWCPPGIIGIGIGGTPEKAMLLAKESIMAPVDIHELKAKAADAAAKGEKLTRAEELRLELYEKVNALGVGAQGLGGLTTVLDVKVLDYPCHAANLPVALVPNCAATRHCHFHLDGSGPAKIEPPKLEDWPAVTWTPVSDPASGLRWEHPGSDPLQAPDMGALAKGHIGSQARLWVAGATPDRVGPRADVTVWGPGGGVTAASVDELLAFHHDMYGRGDAPYPKALTIAGAPARAFDASDDQDSRFEAVAFVDGTVVLVELYVPKGEPLDPAVFERFVGSFAKG